MDQHQNASSFFGSNVSHSSFHISGASVSGEEDCLLRNECVCDVVVFGVMIRNIYSRLIIMALSRVLYSVCM